MTEVTAILQLKITISFLKALARVQLCKALRARNWPRTRQS
jgi:hypothetical protein